jgi:hypothetical protein
VMFSCEQSLSPGEKGSVSLQRMGRNGSFRPCKHEHHPSIVMRCFSRVLQLLNLHSSDLRLEARPETQNARRGRSIVDITYSVCVCVCVCVCVFMCVHIYV